MNGSRPIRRTALLAASMDGWSSAKRKRFVVDMRLELDASGLPASLVTSAAAFSNALRISATIRVRISALWLRASARRLTSGVITLVASPPWMTPTLAVPDLAILDDFAEPTAGIQIGDRA